MRFLSYLTFLLLLPVLILAQSAQNQSTYRSPLDIPLYLSGTFAELRTNHFHSGIDIRTAGVEGKPVYAIEDGVVNRVNIAPSGFGKALYVLHPKTGHVSVYAHLQRFAPKIATYAKKNQYANKSFSVNLFPSADQFPVKKGDIIAYAGNSGSSGGPHLHFEIRDAKTEEVLNPLAFGFQVKDYIRPSISRLAIYPESNEAAVNGRQKPVFFEVQGWGEQHRIKDNQIVKANGTISFGISTIDKFNDTPNQNGVYSVELFIDSVKIFGYTATRFSFDETRYINSFIDYAFLEKNDSRIVRTAIDPFNKLRIYDKMNGKGTFKLIAGQKYAALYVVKDIHGNVSKLPFTIEGLQSNEDQLIEKQDSTKSLLVAGTSNKIESENYYALFPSDAFYRNEIIEEKSEINTAYLSDIVTIGNPTIPVHKNYQLGIKPKNTSIPNQKMLIVSLENAKKPSAIGGKFENGKIVVSTRTLGRFAIMADTIPPSIKAINFKNGMEVDSLKTLRLEISDDFSGIETINPSLNGKWVLMDYDPKNKLLIYEIDELLKKGENKFRLELIDQCNNKKVFEAVIHKKL